MSNENINGISLDGPESPIETPTDNGEVLQTSGLEIELDAARAGHWEYKVINGALQKVWVAG